MRQCLPKSHICTEPEQDQSGSMKMCRKENKEYYAVLEGHRLAQPTIYSSWLVDLQNEQL
jgi:hypothetical protein